MTTQQMWGWSAAVFMATMVWVLFPNRDIRREMREHIVYVQPDKEIPLSQAQAEARNILAEAQQATSRGVYPAETYLAHLKRLTYLEKHSRFRCVFCQEDSFGGDGVIALLKTQCANLFFGQEQRHKQSERFAALRDNDEELAQIQNFVPEEVHWRWGPLWAHLGHTYPLTVLLALLYHSCVLACRQKNILAELLMPDRLARAAVLWPVHLWYETREPREQFRRAAYAVASALAMALCLFLPTTASGQIKNDPGKKRTDRSLQLDLRNTHFVGEDGPPDPNLFGRATFYSGRLVLESITTANPNPGQWYSELGAGIAVVNGSHARVNILIIGSQNHARARKLMAGAQVFIPRSWGTFAVPVLRLERDLETDTNALALATNPAIKAGPVGWRSRLALAPDFSIRWVEDQPATWNAGAGLRFSSSSKRRNTVEVGVLHNSLRQTQLRGRVILTFTF